MRVLVADDDRSMRVLIVRLLETVGVPGAVEASDGNEALELAQQREFDLVVIDWEMPGRSGVDVVRAIRAGGSRVPILMVTVRAERSQILEAIEAGVSDFLTKPVEADVLKDKLRRICQHVDSLKEFEQKTGASTRVEYLNPFVTSIISLFDTMLKTEIARGTPFVKTTSLPEHDVSGVIGLAGKAKGAAVLSLGEETALRATERLLGERPSTIDADVIDTVGELTNIVAGGAKAQLQQLEMSLGLPSVITGKDHSIDFPSGLTPVCIPFQCDWGPVTLQVGLKDEPEQLIASGHSSACQAE